MDVASSPTAGVCLSPPVLRVSSRERSEISDAIDTENFSCSFCSSFHFALYNDKQEFTNILKVSVLLRLHAQYEPYNRTKPHF